MVQQQNSPTTAAVFYALGSNAYCFCSVDPVTTLDNLLIVSITETKVDDPKLK